MIIDVFHIC